MTQIYNPTFANLKVHSAKSTSAHMAEKSNIFIKDLKTIYYIFSPPLLELFFIAKVIFSSCFYRQAICHSQCTCPELCHHLLQWCLLWDDRVFPAGHHAEAMHLRLPARTADQSAHYCTGSTGSPGLGGTQSGDHLPPQGRWVCELYMFIVVQWTWECLWVMFTECCGVG